LELKDKIVVVVFLVGKSKNYSCNSNVNVIKIGSGCLFDDKNRLNVKILKKKAREIENNFSKIVIVASGAIALGKRLENEKRSNDEINLVELQGYASIGQIALMRLYQKLFNRKVSQILLTSSDLRYANNLKALIEENVRKNRITIINYNDTTDFSQLRKDNDVLSAKILSYIGADSLIILGKYNGFYDKDKLIRRVRKIDKETYKLCNGKSKHGTGGFRTKLKAAEIVLKNNKKMIIGNINQNLSKLVNGGAERTIFLN